LPRGGGKEGGTASARRARLKGVWGRGPGAEPLVGHAESFLSIFIQKKWLNVKNLNENLPPCLRQTVSRRHDQPSFGQWGDGGPVGPQLDPPLLVLSLEVAAHSIFTPAKDRLKLAKAHLNENGGRPTNLNAK